MDNFELEEETMASLQRSMISEEFSQTYQDMENFLADYPRRIVSEIRVEIVETSVMSRSQSI